MLFVFERPHPMKTWRNTIRRHRAYPSEYIKVKNMDTVMDAVRKAEEEKIRIRAVGSGHSFSAAAVVPVGGILLDMRKINGFELYNRAFVRKEFKDKHLIHIGAGLTIHDLNKKLEKLNLSIINMGGIDHQTFSGALSTGTHGSGVGLPALSGMVRSIVLVSNGGKVFRIEPDNGITNPNAYSAYPRISLIQDSKVFNSVVVSLGAMGIIYSLVIEVVRMYWLEETKLLCDWPQIKPLLADGSIHESVRSVMIQDTPYKKKNGGRSCILVSHRQIDEPEKPLTVNESSRNWLGTLGNNALVYNFILWQMNRNPAGNIGKIETSLRSLRDRIYVNKSHKVLYQGVEYIKERAYDSEFAFDLGQDKYLEALEELFECAEKTAHEKGIYESAPLGLRFVKKSEAYLTPEFGKDVCYIDTPFLVKTRGADELLGIYGKILLKHGGIPHWGKINDVLSDNPGIIRDFYPMLEVWQHVYREFNSGGIFNNEFTDRMGLTFKHGNR
jgi:hypothetical protein